MTVLQNVMEGLVTVQKMAKKEAREKPLPACSRSAWQNI